MLNALIAYLVMAALIALATKDAYTEFNGVEINWAMRSFIGPFVLMFVGLVVLLIGFVALMFVLLFFAILLLFGAILALPVLLLFM